ncbi:MAG: hypothetical protein Q8P83_03650 [bacterium]|nr:hypothetical protein [bacterium]
MKTNGVKSMPRPSVVKSDPNPQVERAILAVLVFFSLYDVGLEKRRIFELLYRASASEEQVVESLANLVSKELIINQDELYSLEPLNFSKSQTSKYEIAKRWKRVDKYFWLLSILPFVENLSVINSLVIGNADTESDIDFFVVTRPGKLYFTRSLIIVLFRMLGVYKTRKKIRDQFCFGFYVSSDRMSLEKVLIKPDDPLFAFWFASFAPLFGRRIYEEFVSENNWIKSYFPNFVSEQRTGFYRSIPFGSRIIKFLTEVILWIPALIVEPMLRHIHIRHTFNLAENHLPNSTTVANEHMLKLHAIDPRIEIRARFYYALQKKA